VDAEAGPKDAQQANYSMKLHPAVVRGAGSAQANEMRQSGEGMDDKNSPAAVAQNRGGAELSQKADYWAI
jgi:hypothetical protein